MKEELKKEELLKLEHLSIQYKVKGGYLSAVNDINLSISRGEVFAVVGGERLRKIYRRTQHYEPDPRRKFQGYRKNPL